MHLREKMKILIDTHILLWMLEGDQRLSAEMKSHIVSADTIFISVASLWECAIKINLGKLRLNIMELISELANLSIEVLEIKPQHLEMLAKLPNVHRDPFDRMLISQAKTEPLVLLTEDEKMQAYFSV